MSVRFLADRLAQRSWEPVALDEPLAPESVPTPALMLDAELFESNLASMATHLAAHGKGLRPHGKTHKCPMIAKRQAEHGALGICVAKLSEALVMANAGVTGILITSPIQGEDKLQLLADLAARADVSCVVDDPPMLAALQAYLATAGASMRVLVDVDVAMGRTGTRDLDRILALADAVAGHSNTTFGGIQHYAGQVMHVQGHAERRERSLALWSQVGEIVQRLRDAGHAPELVSGGGTGTYDIDVAVPELTELQAGSYAFMDQEYLEIGGVSSERFDPFHVALTVRTRAISQPLGARAITVDCGFKAMASDTIPPAVLDLAGAKFRFGGDEHGIVILAEGSQQPLLGHSVALTASHCDPTVNLHDYYWVVRDGVVQELWPITGRGCTW